ncbi:MAG: LysM peptidoglycan-binding domain-containing protein [Pseudomonadota bacterium]
MDLFGFAKDVGRRLFNTEDDAVDKIRELIEENNPGVTNLGVEFNQGIVSLSGECDSAAAMQQCALLAGNVQGVADVYVNRMTVKAPATPVQSPDIVAATAATPAAQAEPVEQTYVIKSGDTLGKIAKEFYGKASAYMKIFEANRGIIENPDRIYPGQTIRIPRD